MVFASEHDRRCYGRPLTPDTVTLEKTHWKAPEAMDMGGDPVIPFLAGDALAWRLIADGYTSTGEPGDESATARQRYSLGCPGIREMMRDNR